MLMTLKFYVVMKYTERAALIRKLEQCIVDIKEWSSANDLKLNSDETEVLHITSKFRKTSPLLSVNIAYFPMLTPTLTPP